MASTTLGADFITVNNQPAGTYGPCQLAGGLYSLTAIFGASATIQLQVVNGPDGATPVNVTPAGLATATPYAVQYFPPGRYQVIIGVAASPLAVQRIKLM
jgi:hypothetical protein